MNYETENVEFKLEYTEDIYKEIIAFANTSGGIIYVGIDDRGNVIGLKDVDKEYTQITNGIRDAIVPDVTMFVRFVLQENQVLRIIVNEGSNKPYYLKKKGLKPGGVYVRQGSSSAPSSFEQIRQMIKENDGDDFESNRSIEENLTFEAAKKSFKQNNIDFGLEKYLNLGIFNSNNNFTNLALLLSDQCVHSIKVAVFSDDECTIFRDSKEFKGSIFKQFEDTIQYLSLCNKTKSEIKGIQRYDRYDYPVEAIREALLNAIIHRDYSFSGSIIINVTDHKMEFISLGGLFSNLSIEDISSGISMSRNKRLQEIFHLLGLVESYGTGIRRIFKLYENNYEKPQLLTTTNTFKIILPNMNNIESLHNRSIITPQMKKVIDYMKEANKISEAQMSDLLNLKKTRTFEIAKQLENMGIIEVNGRGKNKYYTLK